MSPKKIIKSGVVAGVLLSLAAAIYIVCRPTPPPSPLPAPLPEVATVKTAKDLPKSGFAVIRRGEWWTIVSSPTPMGYPNFSLSWGDGIRVYFSKNAQNPDLYDIEVNEFGLIRKIGNFTVIAPPGRRLVCRGTDWSLWYVNP